MPRQGYKCIGRNSTRRVCSCFWTLYIARKTFFLYEKIRTLVVCEKNIRNTAPIFFLFDCLVECGVSLPPNSKLGKVNVLIFGQIRVGVKRDSGHPHPRPLLPDCEHKCNGIYPQHPCVQQTPPQHNGDILSVATCRSPGAHFRIWRCCRGGRSRRGC